MNSFDLAIQEREAQLKAPLAEAKRALAPTRAAAVEGLKHTETTIARLRPVFYAAIDKNNKAAAVGVTHTALRDHLIEAVGDANRTGLIDWAAEGYRDLIRSIDGLTDKDLAQKVPLYLAGGEKKLSANAGRLEWLAERIEKQDLPELEQILIGRH